MNEGAVLLVASTNVGQVVRPIPLTCLQFNDNTLSSAAMKLTASARSAGPAPLPRPQSGLLLQMPEGFWLMR